MENGNERELGRGERIRERRENMHGNRSPE
jgi:hypothetical protein